MKNDIEDGNFLEGSQYEDLLENVNSIENALIKVFSNLLFCIYKYDIPNLSLILIIENFVFEQR